MPRMFSATTRSAVLSSSDATVPQKCTTPSETTIFEAVGRRSGSPILQRERRRSVPRARAYLRVAVIEARLPVTPAAAESTVPPAENNSLLVRLLVVQHHPPPHFSSTLQVTQRRARLRGRSRLERDRRDFAGLDESKQLPQIFERADIGAFDRHHLEREEHRRDRVGAAVTSVCRFG